MRKGLRLKRVIKYLIFLLLRLPLIRIYRDYLLSTWVSPEKRNSFDSFFFPLATSTWLEFVYLQEKDPNKRVKLQEKLMGDEASVAWAKHYYKMPFPPNPEEKIGALTFSEACPVFERLEKICRESNEKLCVFQIGTSSGREIVWLAKKFPQHEFIGTDLFPQVIELARYHYNLTNLKFVTVAAKDFHTILEPCKNRRAIVFSSGSLQYVQPEHLKEFFSNCAHSNVKLEIHLNEPAKTAGGIEPNQLKKSTWRGNLSYSHDYDFYSAQSGFKVTVSNIIYPYRDTGEAGAQRDVVHYDFACQKN